jgi:hypothetical protein
MVYPMQSRKRGEHCPLYFGSDDTKSMTDILPDPINCVVEVVPT